jgi:putative spermidine/putrescine transport system substrate-binding protein
MIVIAGMLWAMAHAATASELTVVAIGRFNENLQTKAYFDPFAKASGVHITRYSYAAEMDQIKDMVAAGKTWWDVVEVETPDLLRGCKDGLFERLSQDKIHNKKDFIPGALSECGVGTYVWSMVMAYDPAQVHGNPASWSEFWDVKKYPGTRGLLRTAKYTLEIALLADGVPASNIYKVLGTEEGVDRAFRKLDEIKPYVKWWEAAPQPPLWLKSRDIAMSAAYTLWIDAAQQQGSDFRMVWNSSLYEIDSWAIVTGAPNPEEAYRFINFASLPKNQQVFSRSVAYGPTNRKAVGMIDAKRANQLPRWGENLRTAVAIDGQFWIAHGEALEERFAKWAGPVIRPNVDEEDDMTK